MSTVNLDWSQIHYKNPDPCTVTFTGSHIVDKRHDNFKNTYNPQQMNMLRYFKNFQVPSEGSGSQANPINCDAAWTRAQADKDFVDVGSQPACYDLTKECFAKGTYRIIHPGYYRLVDDIDFKPVPDASKPDSFMPSDTQQTTQSGANGPDYPVRTSNPAGYYHMGFFAAITIEAEGVVLDLNGHIIQQSQLHQLQQRFFACIETAAAPFIQTGSGSAGPSQFGPATAAPQIAVGNNIWICNGKLQSSSHHGIHGNLSNNVVIENLIISNFEIAAIHMNGADTMIIRDIHIPNGSDDVRVNAMYSQARFLLPFLQRIIDLDGGAKPTKLTIGGVDTSVTQIQTALTTAMNEIIDAIKNRTPLSDVSSAAQIFLMTGGEVDGNRYGLVCAQKGPVVGGFQPGRNPANGNSDVTIHNVVIENLDTNPLEILACSTADAAMHDSTVAYGGARTVDAVGGVIRIRDMLKDNGRYKSNVLANAQFIIKVAKDRYGDGDLPGGQWGKTNIPDVLIKQDGNDSQTGWVANATNIDNVIDGAEDSLYYVGLGDSMGHHMKGDIGIFLQGADKAKLFDIDIHNMHNISNMGIEFSDLVSSALPPNSYQQTPGAYLGASNHGVAIVACENVDVENVEISDMSSKSGVSNAILVRGNCGNILISGCKFTNITCGKPSNQGNDPNQLMTCNYINYNDIGDSDEISVKA